MYVVCQRSTCSSARSHVRSPLISCTVVRAMRHNQNRLSLTVFAVRSSVAVIVITGPGGCRERWDPGARLREDVPAKGLSLSSLSKKDGDRWMGLFILTVDGDEMGTILAEESGMRGLA